MDRTAQALCRKNRFLLLQKLVNPFLRSSSLLYKASNPTYGTIELRVCKSSQFVETVNYSTRLLYSTQKRMPVEQHLTSRVVQ